MRIHSTIQTNSAPTFIVQPPIAPTYNSQPPNHVHVLGPTIPGTSYVYLENEEEENEETKLQTHQQRPTAFKRALVDVIGKSLYINLLKAYNVMYSYICNIIFCFSPISLKTNVFNISHMRK